MSADKPKADGFTAARLAWLDQVFEDHELTRAAFKTAYAIFRRFNRKHFTKTSSLEAWPGIEALAEALDLYDRPVRNHVEALIDRGHLRTLARGGGYGANRFARWQACLKEQEQNRQKTTGESSGENRLKTAGEATDLRLKTAGEDRLKTTGEAPTDFPAVSCRLSGSKQPDHQKLIENSLKETRSKELGFSSEAEALQRESRSVAYTDEPRDSPLQENARAREPHGSPLATRQHPRFDEFMKVFPAKPGGHNWVTASAMFTKAARKADPDVILRGARLYAHELRDQEPIAAAKWLITEHWKHERPA